MAERGGIADGDDGDGGADGGGGGDADVAIAAAADTEQNTFVLHFTVMKGLHIHSVL